MKARLSDSLFQLVLVVVATVVAGLILRALAGLSVNELVVVGLVVLVLAEAAIIVMSWARRRADKGSAAEDSSPKPFGESLWMHGWKRIDYAIGLIDYAGVLWTPKVPESQGIYATHVGVEQPARCPECRTGLIEIPGQESKHVWRCAGCNFEMTSDVVMRTAAHGAELKAQRAWERYKEQKRET